MTQTTCEMIWLKSFLPKLGVVQTPMSKHYDNQTAIFIISNLVFHERTKHIEVDCHHVRSTVMKGIISTPYVSSSNQRADIFTKCLALGVFEVFCNKLGMTNIYTLV